MISKEALHKKTAQEITALLYEAGLDNLEEAKLAINKNNYANANVHLQKVSDILERLGAGLNYEAGIIADQLDALYNYMADKVIEANFSKNTDLIDEVHGHLSTLATAWHKAQKKNVDVQPKHLKQKTNVYEQNSMFID
ncbi:MULTISPECIES: flagellar export chaperone FliS [Bacillaceae]|uniref:Flagellar secretion chaperone FliS n=1 Tax=Evansella alkalicola TaxID=745819 RepID=A0ABS6JZR2_9BACI|nr:MULTISPECIES: flagellar export chaperone FliS [Bacillaceae]MBU9724074.1 flagellar export chaperone FliS [Bacillus alkalicola]